MSENTLRPPQPPRPPRPEGDLYDDGAPPELVEAVRAFANTVTWKTASTDKSDPPHSYVLDFEGPLSARRQGLKAEYDAAWDFIDRYGVVRRWKRWEYRSCDLVLDDGVTWSFWIMGAGGIINRKPAEHAGWSA